jgi:predicted metal-dependent hydrolase
MAIKPTRLEIQAGTETLTVSIEVDPRLRKTARWLLRGQIVLLRVPRRMTRKQVDDLIAQITPRIVRQRKRASRQTDINLMHRAAFLNDQYFGGELSWHSIRWVHNMRHRLGSCTTGGTTDGDIRISERIRGWPQYVVDYILAHEICHRKFPNHSSEFWGYLGRYPFTQKAIGFLEGISFAEGSDPSTLID